MPFPVHEHEYLTWHLHRVRGEGVSVLLYSDCLKPPVSSHFISPVGRTSRWFKAISSYLRREEVGTYDNIATEPTICSYRKLLKMNAWRRNHIRSKSSCHRLPQHCFHKTYPASSSYIKFLFSFFFIYRIPTVWCVFSHQCRRTL